MKLITELNIGNYETGGGDEPSTNPEWPDKSSLTLGNTVSFAAREWIVSHITETEAYLTFKDLAGYSTWDGLQSSCTLFEKQLTEEQKACLKRVTADSTSGKVFVATYTQMNGGFSYFNSNSRRKVAGIFGTGERYWTSTSWDSSEAYGVDSDGNISPGTHYDKSNPIGFRPSVCVNLTLYNQ